MIRRRFVASLIAVALLGMFATPVDADLAEAATPTPDQIYANAQRVWTAHVPPAHLSYVIAVTETQNDVAKTRHYRVNEDTLDGTVAADAISAEEAVDTNNVTGVKFIAAIRSHGNDFKKQLTAGDADFLGVPQLAPDYTFGVARRRMVDYLATPEPEPSTDATAIVGKHIGSVSAVARRYAITLTGTETIGDRSAYHLTLVPLADPARYRLRDMWVDTATSDVLQLRSAGNFDSKFTRGVPWLVTFRGDGDARYIASEIAEKPIDFGEKHRYDAVQIVFSGITAVHIAPVTLGNIAPTPGLALLREP